MDSNQPEKTRSLAEKFKEHQTKGESQVNPGEPENELIRISLSHPFPGQKDRVAWISIPFTRKELLENSVEVDNAIKATIKKVELTFAEFDEGMKLVAPLVPALLPNRQAPPAQPPIQAPAVADGSAPAPVCEFCGTPKYWKPPGVSQKSGQAYNGFWACATYTNHPPKAQQF